MGMSYGWVRWQPQARFEITYTIFCIIIIVGGILAWVNHKGEYRELIVVNTIVMCVVAYFAALFGEQSGKKAKQ